MRPLLAALLIASALAAPAAAGGALAFPSVDLNKDGVISWPEANRKLTRLARVQFDKCDTNRDGLLDKGEYANLQSFYWLNYGA